MVLFFPQLTLRVCPDAGESACTGITSFSTSLFAAFSQCVNKEQAWIKPGARERNGNLLPGTFSRLAGTFRQQSDRECLGPLNVPARQALNNYMPRLKHIPQLQNCSIFALLNNIPQLSTWRMGIFFEKTFHCVWNLTSFFMENALNANQYNVYISIMNCTIIQTLSH